MKEDRIFKCIAPMYAGEGEDEFEVLPGSEWLLMPVAPEGYEITLETTEEDSACQLWLYSENLKKHFKEVSS